MGASVGAGGAGGMGGAVGAGAGGGTAAGAGGAARVATGAGATAAGRPVTAGAAGSGVAAAGSAVGAAAGSAVAAGGGSDGEGLAGGVDALGEGRTAAALSRAVDGLAAFCGPGCEQAASMHPAKAIPSSDFIRTVACTHHGADRTGGRADANGIGELRRLRCPTASDDPSQAANRAISPCGNARRWVNRTSTGVRSSRLGKSAQLQIPQIPKERDPRKETNRLDTSRPRAR